MHKYKPRVHIIQHDPRVDLSQIRSLPAEGVHSFSFPETEFTTVTAYQNQQVHRPDPLKHNLGEKICLFQHVLGIENAEKFYFDSVTTQRPRQSGNSHRKT